MTIKRTMTNTMLAGLTVSVLAGCATADSGAPAAPSAPAPAMTAAAETPSHAKDGFYTQLDKDGRLWVFLADSPELAEFKTKGKPAKHVVRPGAGPGGVTLKAVEMDTIVAYITAQPGFYTQLDKDGRLWVFLADSPELAEFKAKGKPAKHVVRPGAGPLGLTIKAVDTTVLDAYQAKF